MLCRSYQEQVSKWPFNPLTRVIAWLEEQRDDKVIGDFGCGEAMIAQRFHDRTVHSFDLIAGNPLITACNMTKVPLNDNTLDICVFCLSLMGQDWPLFVVEATRCLKEGGVIKIVEVRSRLTSIEEFEKFLESLGYKKDNAVSTDVRFLFVKL
ncbi:-Ribosomal RNA-processing protein 8 [Babesia bigemina]|uniref:Ribosomal RNA-processing protein 8 n=1 Tax=Babesia bigemina TaxID=5866 RepID=A0A061DDL4_BABBI|nr:-Ribosomal RNA-processing protein 8 [Babesia bigemina]CDR97524.1 -Ribosomal RNA-processing protein 8 [Babesia bigemina]|eukprot:XP_012769710.1 -Ribosomal RNA-processing protein 8 [Babesia bigemina]